MRKASALDFLVVTRSIGYALTIIGALLAVVFIAFSAMSGPFFALPFGAAFLPLLIAGLALAWTSSLARVLVRRARFESDREQ